MIRRDRRAAEALRRKCEGEQAGAEQHEAGRGQGEEAFGDEVMVAHVNTLPTRRSSQLIKTFGTSSLMKIRFVTSGCRRTSGPRQNTLKCVGEENAGSDKAHRRCNHFEHCSRPLRPRACTHQTTQSPTQSKTFRTATAQCVASGALAQQVCQNRAGQSCRRGVKATIG